MCMCAGIVVVLEKPKVMSIQQEEPADCKLFTAVNHFLTGSLTHCYQRYVKEVVHNGFLEVSRGELRSYFEHRTTLYILLKSSCHGFNTTLCLICIFK